MKKMMNIAAARQLTKKQMKSIYGGICCSTPGGGCCDPLLECCAPTFAVLIA
jgi:bacteriocin-like protein